MVGGLLSDTGMRLLNQLVWLSDLHLDADTL